jgi:sugar transferase (PEP-CTERM system associated)
MRISFSPLEILFSVIFTTGFIFITIGVFSFIVPELGVGGIIYYLTGLIVFLFLMFWRISLQVYLNNYTPLHNVLIIGGGVIAFELAELIENSRRLGFHLVGIASKEKIHPPKNPDGQFPTWSIEDVKPIIDKNRINKIIVAQEERRGVLPVKELLEYKIKGVDVIEWQGFYENLAGKIPVKSLPPSYFIFKEGFSVSSIAKTISRMFDIVVSFLFLLALFPIFLVVISLIKLDSEGPAFYFQKRVGQKGKIFNLIKFRTMVADAENSSGAKWASKEDPRITRIGRYLRRYRIDEFPQMVNVLKGEMAIVGPRPERPEFVEILEKELPYYSLRHSIKPGITGWAQVKASYSGTIAESRDKLEYDLFYLKNKSLKYDLYICFKTIKTLLLGRGGR